MDCHGNRGVARHAYGCCDNHNTHVARGHSAHRRARAASDRAVRGNVGLRQRRLRAHDALPRARARGGGCARDMRDIRHPDSADSLGDFCGHIFHCGRARSDDGRRDRRAGNRDKRGRGGDEGARVRKCGFAAGVRHQKGARRRRGLGAFQRGVRVFPRDGLPHRGGREVHRRRHRRARSRLRRLFQEQLDARSHSLGRVCQQPPDLRVYARKEQERGGLGFGRRAPWVFKLPALRNGGRVLVWPVFLLRNGHHAAREGLRFFELVAAHVFHHNFCGVVGACAARVERHERPSRERCCGSAFWF